jgi:DNA-binding response OmpR family regulator
VEESSNSEILRSGDLELHPSEFLVFARGRVLMLTRKELQMLTVMVRGEGRILSRDELYALAWGKKLRPGDRTVDVYVRKLRTRLEQALPEQTFIHTHFGFGYRFSPEPSINTHRQFTSG